MRFYVVVGVTLATTFFLVRPLKRVFIILLVALTLSGVGALRGMAQPLPLAVAYYDVDRLYDTQRSAFYDDSDYTPEGRYDWTEARYRRKVENIASVIDSLGLPLVALRGVENEQVVRDLTDKCKADYAYVHRQQDFSHGMDFALLYFGDMFVVERVTSQHNLMCVEGEYYDKPLAIVIHYNSDDLSYVMRNLRKENPLRPIILVGGSYDALSSSLGLRDVTATLAASGFGTRVWRGRWQMFDTIASDIEGRVHCGVYIKRWLLGVNGEPLPTFGRGRYMGGYSSHLPVYAYFDEFFAH